MSKQEIGIIKRIGETVIISEKFRKRTFVLETEGDYPQPIEFQLAQDKVDLINDFAEGQKVEISFNLRGREWTNPKDGELKVFNTLDAWKIEEK